MIEDKLAHKHWGLERIYLKSLQAIAIHNGWMDVQLDWQQSTGWKYYTDAYVNHMDK